MKILSGWIINLVILHGGEAHGILSSLTSSWWSKGEGLRTCRRGQVACAGQRCPAVLLFQSKSGAVGCRCKNTLWSVGMRISWHTLQVQPFCGMSSLQLVLCPSWKAVCVVQAFKGQAHLIQQGRSGTWWGQTARLTPWTPKLWKYGYQYSKASHTLVAGQHN